MKRMILLLLVAMSLFSMAQDSSEKKKNWTNQTLFSLVHADGNSDTRTFGLSNEFTKTWDTSDLDFKISALEGETTTITHQAVGTSSDFFVEEIKNTQKTAERYEMDLQYNHKINQDFFWFTGAEWLKNEPAGVDTRTSFTLGAGYKFVERDELKFNVKLGVSQTRDVPVAEVPGYDESFASARLGWNLEWKPNKSTSFKQTMKSNVNLEQNSDTLTDLENKLVVSMTDKVALQIGLKLTHDSEPSYSTIDLYNESGAQIGTVPFQQDELDIQLSTSLSLQF